MAIGWELYLLNPRSISVSAASTALPGVDGPFQVAHGRHYLENAESVLMVGNPGLGKTHLAIGLGLVACRQDRRVRFYTVTQRSLQPRFASAASYVRVQKCQPNKLSCFT